MGILKAIAIFCLFVALRADSLSGLKILINDQLFQDIGSIGIPKLFDQLNDYLVNPHNFSFAQTIFGIDIKLNMINLTAFEYNIDPYESKLQVISKNHAFFIQTPIINEWQFSFNYDYQDLFGKSSGKCILQLTDCLFNVETKLLQKRNKLYVQIDGLSLNFGSSVISFSSGFTPKLVEFLFNNFNFLGEVFAGWVIPPIVNMISLPALTTRIPLFGNVGLDIGFSEGISQDKNWDQMYLKVEFFDFKNKKYPFKGPVTDLHLITSSAHTFTILSNELLLNSFFRTLDYTNIINIILTNETFNKFTDSLYLTTSDFIYYLPQLVDKYGDVSVQLKLGDINRIPPQVTFNAASQGIIVNGAFDCMISPMVRKKYLNSMEFQFNLTFGLYPKIVTNNNTSTFSLTVTPITISNLIYIPHDNIALNDTASLQYKFNNLFMFLTNAINIYGIQNIVIPTDFDFMKLSDPQIIINNGYVSFGADITIMKLFKF